MLEYLYFAKLLRILQLLRVTRLSRVAGEWRFNFGLSYNGGLVTITLMIIFTALHFAACMWASLCRPNFEYSWLNAFHSIQGCFMDGGGVGICMYYSESVFG